MKCYHNEPMENVQEIALFETFWKYAAYDYCRTVYGKSVICMRNAYAHPQLLAQHVHLNDFEPASMTADSVHIFNHLISLAFSLKIRSKKKEASLPAIVWTIRRRSTCKDVCSPKFPFFSNAKYNAGSYKYIATFTYDIYLNMLIKYYKCIHIASKQKRYLHPKIIKVMNCIFKWICLKYFEIFQHISDWKNSGNHRDFIRFPYSKISSKIFQLSCFDEAVHGCRPTRVCPFCPTAMTTLLQTPEFTLVDGSQHQGNKKIKKKHVYQFQIWLCV